MFVNYLQADATYKINLNRYPLIIVGTSDRDRCFHPSGVALCSGEQHSDYAFVFNAVKTACQAIYGITFNPHFLLAVELMLLLLMDLKKFLEVFSFVECVHFTSNKT
jgi:hypothetical protein